MKGISIFGLSLTLCLVLISCVTPGGSSPAANDGVPKTLIITGINDYVGDILVTLSSTSSPAASMVAVGGAAVSGDTVTIPLVVPGREDNRWSGVGDFFVVLVFEHDNNAIYFYSGGGMSALRYSFGSATTTIPLSQFRRN